MSRSASSAKMSDVIQTSDSSANSLISSSIEFDVAELFINHSKTLPRSLFTPEIIAHAEMNYDEDFGPNKRSFEKESRPVQNSTIPPMSDSADDDRRRRKEQKRVAKKMKSQSVIEMFNEILEKYDTSISICQILKSNKMNIS
jgi:hypothetical protein